MGFVQVELDLFVVFDPVRLGENFDADDVTIEGAILVFDIGYEDVLSESLHLDKCLFSVQPRNINPSLKVPALLDTNIHLLKTQMLLENSFFTINFHIFIILKTCLLLLETHEIWQFWELGLVHGYEIETVDDLGVWSESVSVSLFCLGVLSQKVDFALSSQRLEVLCVVPQYLVSFAHKLEVEALPL